MAVRICRRASQQWIGDSRGRFEGNTLVVETRNLKFNEKSRFGVGYLNGLSDENLRVVERFTRTDANTLTYQATIEDPDGIREAVDGRDLDGSNGRARSTKSPATKATTGCSTSCRDTARKKRAALTTKFTKITKATQLNQPRTPLINM